MGDPILRYTRRHVRQPGYGWITCVVLAGLGPTAFIVVLGANECAEPTFLIDGTGIFLGVDPL